MKRCLKNTFLFLLGITFLISCSKDEIRYGKNYSSNIANEVTKESVLDIAQNFFKHNNSTTSKGIDNTKTIKDIIEHKTLKNLTAFYVINYVQGGFIVIAADDRISPILAFSDTGTFSSTPVEIISPVQYWMEGIKDQVQNTIDHNLTQNKEIKLEWEGLKVKNTTQVKSTSITSKEPEPAPTDCPDINFIKGPFLTTVWGQGDGYNNLVTLNCPNNYGGKAPTGCVATAMAQVMRYFHKSNTYNWTNMPDNGQYSLGTYDTQLSMRHAGEAVTMQYGCYGSGAYSQDIAPALINIFGYSTASFAAFNLNTVIQNIDSNKPVIISGGTDSGGNYVDGHAWVCDGYIQSTIFFKDDYGNCTGQGVTYYPILHMNWGWNNDYNGYYSISNFNPGSMSFNFQRSMVYNITL